MSCSSQNQGAIEPAIVVDRYWNLLLTNDAATRLLSTFIDLDKLQTLFCVDGKIKFFSTIATLGTPYDITLQKLRIECLFPADEMTEQYWEQHKS